MKRISVLMLVLLACFVLVAWSPALAKDKYVIQTFDPPLPPGGLSPYQGTQAIAINSQGIIAGFYSDTLFVYHGLIRTPDGAIAVFDAPDAGTQSVAGFVHTPMGVLGGQGTYATAINDAGTITGFYADITNVLHGFLRTTGGTITKVDVPGAGNGAGQGTMPANISKNGTIAGTYVDVNGISHIFLLNPRGLVTKIDAPGAGTGAGQGTFMGWASTLTQNGALSGYYLDAGNVAHGLFRAYYSTLFPFDAPGAGWKAGQGTYAWSINNAMQITGAFEDSLGVMHGYVRYANGSYRMFDVPGAGRASGQGTVPEGINLHGVIVGNFINTYGEGRGFRRAWGGSMKRFRVPDAGTGVGQGTIPLTNNKSGVTTGSYFDSNFVMHGFLITW